MTSTDTRPPEVQKAPVVEETPHRIWRRPVIWATAISASAAVVGHLLLWIGYTGGFQVGTRPLIPWQPVTGIALSVVAIVSFGGFYLASRLPRMAIAASFLLTFFVFFTFALTIEALDLRADSTAADLVDDLRKVVSAVALFYFGSETVISGLKVWGASKPGSDADAVRNADLT